MTQLNLENDDEILTFFAATVGWLGIADIVNRHFSHLHGREREQFKSRLQYNLQRLVRQGKLQEGRNSGHQEWKNDTARL